MKNRKNLVKTKPGLSMAHSPFWLPIWWFYIFVQGVFVGDLPCSYHAKDRQKSFLICVPALV